MAQREGSIYLYLFVLMLILFAVMTVLFLSTNTEKATISSEKAQLESDIERYEDEKFELSTDIDKLKVLIGGPTYSEGDWPGNESFLQNDELQKAVNDTYKYLGHEDVRTYEFLVEPYEDIPRLLRELKVALVAATRTGCVSARSSWRSGARSAWRAP